MRCKVLILSTVLLASGLAGCVADGDGSASVYVQDAPTDEFREVHVVFTNVYIHQAGDEADDRTQDGQDGSTDGQGGQGGQGGPPGSGAQAATLQPSGEQRSGGSTAQFSEEAGWIELAADPDGIDVDLLNATGTRAAFLGEANLSAGLYTQIAIVVDQAYGIDEDGSRVDITVPSGTGRVVRSFNVSAGQETQIIVDLELDRALVQSGQGWKLTPVFGKTTTRTVDNDASGDEAHEPGEVAEVQG